MVGTSAAKVEPYPGDSPAPNPDTPGFRYRFRHETYFRRRVFHTASVVWAYIAMGWMVGMSGPAFPDIRLIIDKDLTTASWLFTAGAIGYLVGSAIAGFALDRFNRLVILSASTTAMSVSMAAIPWCSDFRVMLVVNVINGLFMGVLDTGGNTHVGSIWGEEAGPFMHSIHFGFSFGAIIGPLASNPFFATARCKEILNTTMSTTIPTQPTTQAASTVGSWTTAGRTDAVLVNTSTASSEADCVEEYGETNVQFAYLTVACLGLLAACPFLLLRLLNKDVQIPSKTTEVGDIGINAATKDVIGSDDQAKTTSNLVELSLSKTILFATLMAALIAVYCGIEARFSGLLMTFALEKLDWTKTQGSVITSIFWATFSFGRLLGVFVVKLLKPVTMLFVYSFGLLLCFVALLLAVRFEIDTLVWVTSSLAGFSMSIIFPTVFVWTGSQIMPVTGKLSACYLVAISAVNLSVPILYGHMMDTVDQMWFVYLLLGQTVLMLALVFVIAVLANVLIRPLKKQLA